MLFVEARSIATVDDAIELLQMAIGIEFSTLPPYLYALYSIPTGDERRGVEPDPSGRDGGDGAHVPRVQHPQRARYQSGADSADLSGAVPGGISGGGKEALTIHLLPFSKDAMAQAMAIEEPEAGPINIPHELALEAAPTFMTIGQFYSHLDQFLSTLPESRWSKDRNQIDDRQFLQGELFAVNGFDDAHRAIQRIVSEGEGTKESPLDFRGEVAHYYRFEEIFSDQVLTKANNDAGFVFKGKLGVDFCRRLSGDRRSGQPRFLERSPGGAGRAGSMR